MNDSTIDWAHIINQALTVEMKDSIHYNQVSGKEMKAYFVNGDMRHIEVIGNVLTAFYPEEKDSTMTGFNCLEGSMLHLYMKDKRMETVSYTHLSNVWKQRASLRMLLSLWQKVWHRSPFSLLKGFIS